MQSGRAALESPPFAPNRRLSRLRRPCGRLSPSTKGAELNWIDIAFLVVLVFGAIIGLRTGVIGAAVIAVGVVAGWYIAGLVSPSVGGFFDRVKTIDTVITTLLYLLLMAAALTLAENAAKWVKRLSAVATLGISTIADRVGGAAVGLLIGFILASVLLLALVRGTYDTELPSEGVAGAAVAKIPEVVETRTVVEDSVAGSFVAPAVVRVYTHLPGNALGLIPSDFMVALETLEDRIEDQQ